MGCAEKKCGINKLDRMSAAPMIAPPKRSWRLMCLSRPQNITPKAKNASRNLAAKRLKVPRVSRPVLLKMYAQNRSTSA